VSFHLKEGYSDSANYKRLFALVPHQLSSFLQFMGLHLFEFSFSPTRQVITPHQYIKSQKSNLPAGRQELKCKKKDQRHKTQDRNKIIAKLSMRILNC